MKKTKILVLGCNGMAGHLISLYLLERGYDVIGFARSASSLLHKTIIGTATDFKLLSDLIINEHFDVIINCIAILNKPTNVTCSESIMVNSVLPNFLSEITSKLKTKIIHLSSESVFSGNSAPYKENSKLQPETFYGYTKALGELNTNKDLTFRNSIIGPDMRPNGTSLFNWFMQQSGTIYGYTETIWSGVTTYCLAKAIESAICENITGIYNLVNNTSISKYNLLKLFNKYFRSDEVNITPCNEIKLDLSLECTRQDFSFVVPTYEQQVIDLREWIDTHSALYPHYNLK